MACVGIIEKRVERCKLLSYPQPTLTHGGRNVSHRYVEIMGTLFVTHFPFWPKNIGAASRDRMFLLSLVTHIPPSREGEGLQVDHLPFWGAEIGQWLGKHVLLTLSLSPLSPLYLTSTPFPRSQK